MKWKRVIDNDRHGAGWYSEDGLWKIYEEYKRIKGGGRTRYYNSETNSFEKSDSYEITWRIQNIPTSDVLSIKFRTLKEAKKEVENWTI